MSASALRVSWVLIGTALLAAALGYSELRYLGFPDGYRSDADRIRAMLLGSLIGVSLLACVASVLVGWRSAPDLVGRRQRILAIAYATMLLVALVGNVYLRGVSGRGG